MDFEEKVERLAQIQRLMDLSRKNIAHYQRRILEFEHEIEVIRASIPTTLEAILALIESGDRLGVIPLGCEDLPARFQGMALLCGTGGLAIPLELGGQEAQRTTKIRLRTMLGMSRSFDVSCLCCLNRPGEGAEAFPTFLKRLEQICDEEGIRGLLLRIPENDKAEAAAAMFRIPITSINRRVIAKHREEFPWLDLESSHFPGDRNW